MTPKDPPDRPRVNTPRAVSVIGDRDLRTTKSPPEGSPAARALSPLAGSVPRNQFPQKEGTPVGADSYEVLAHRAKVAADGVRDLRQEMREDTQATNSRIDTVIGQVADVREDVGRLDAKLEGIDSKLDIVTTIMTQQIKASTDMAMVRVTETTKVETAQAMVHVHAQESEIATQNEVAKVKSQIWLKVVGFVFSTAGLGAVIALIATRC